MRTTIREGFIVGVTNPKGLIIFTAILPPFIDRAQGHATLQLLTLGAICIVIAMLSDGTWGLAFGHRAPVARPLAASASSGSAPPAA